MGRHYRSDFYGWTQDQADALRRRSVNEIDWDNLLEEIEGLGRSERRELRSRLALIVQHLLKWRHQPGHRSKSWALTIIEQRSQVSALIEDNPSLIPQLDELTTAAYSTGLSGAVAETGLAASVFQSAEPIRFDELMTVALVLDKSQDQDGAS